MKRILAGELRVGEALPWDIFDERGQLLLAAGTIIGSIRQVESLLLRGALRTGPMARERGSVTVARGASDDEMETPFEQLDGLIQRLAAIFTGIESRQAASSARCERLLERLEQLLETESDAMLGAIHLVHEHPYTLIHPIRCASLAALLCTTRGYAPARRRSVMLAALLQNVSMLQLQQQLVQQSGALSAAQQRLIEDHPEASARLAAAAGIDDGLALTIVRQHHERADGSGYPHRLGQEDILEEAGILQLADRYCAMIAARSYREALTPGESLRVLYTGQAGMWRSELIPQLIQMIGIYPPGSFVILGSGETGIVVKRGKRSTEPLVRAYISPRGGPYPGIFTRDCSTPAFRIVRVAKPDLTIPFDLSRIWGYRE